MNVNQRHAQVNTGKGIRWQSKRTRRPQAALVALSSPDARPARPPCYGMLDASSGEMDVSVRLQLSTGRSADRVALACRSRLPSALFRHGHC